MLIRNNSFPTDILVVRTLQSQYFSYENTIDTHMEIYPTENVIKLKIHKHILVIP
jgi:hypothetical protein